MKKNREELKEELEALKNEIAKGKKEKSRENIGEIIFGLIFMVGVGIWLFNGGFGQIARFLFVMGLFQK
jgi:hypothetical protein